MSEPCGAPHPERAEVVCDRGAHQGAGFHRNRATGLVWEAAALPDVRRRGRWGLAPIAARTRNTERTGPPDSGRREPEPI